MSKIASTKLEGSPEEAKVSVLDTKLNLLVKTMTESGELPREFEKYFELAKACYQCGTCTAGCPVFRQLSQFNPRVIIESVFLENSEKLFDELPIWLCSNCYTCSTRCPQGIDVTHVLTQLKNLSVKLKNVPPGIITEMEAILETGRTAAISQSILKKREKLGLPELPEPNLQEIQKLLDVTGAVAQIKKIKEEEWRKLELNELPELTKVHFEDVHELHEVPGVLAQIKKVKEEAK
ncbi:MAG: 4Fe-4S dicluster domain-containing protein [Candidatus Heimdallarchaeota archaeon]|nr:4Fe-4S dicluster domain-containing protein [Candidatus Heimdallarchaeota archaeon]